MADVEDDTDSWKDRCDRYFTSLTDSDGKADNPEKPSMHVSDGKFGEKENWKSLGELKKQESKRSYHLKRSLLLLDIHGTRICGTAKHMLEQIVWIVIIIASVAAIVYVIKIQVDAYHKQTRVFETIAVQTDVRNSGGSMVSFCNKNMLRKSTVTGTRFADLVDIDSGIQTAHINVKTNKETTTNVIKSNKKLNALLTEQLGESLDDFMTELQDDIAIKILSETSNVSVLYSLAVNGSSDILLDYLNPSLTEEQIHGHTKEDMLVRCILDGRACRESELLQVTHKDLGNCITVQPSSVTAQGTLEVMLDVENDEYLNILSPSVGVIMVVHSDDLLKTSSSTLRRSKHTASPNRHLDVSIVQQVSLKREDDVCNQDGSYDKEACLETCVDNQRGEICGCRAHHPTLPACRKDIFTQYVCVRVVEKLQFMGKLPCSCPEKCRETFFETKSTFLNWPSEKNLVSLIAANALRNIRKANVLNSSHHMVEREFIASPFTLIHAIITIIARNPEVPWVNSNDMKETENTFVEAELKLMRQTASLVKMHVQSQMKQIGRDADTTYIRNNLMKVTVSLTPADLFLIEERQSETLLTLFAQIGGLTALIAGVSLITLVEVLWTALKMIGHFISYFRQRNDVRKVQRLTDSDITSITWAMHRLRRREEEIQKEVGNKHHKRNNKNEPNILTGNVQNRIARRNSYLSPVTEETLKVHTKAKDAAHRKLSRHSETDRDTSHRSGHGRLYDSSISRQVREKAVLPYHEFIEHTYPRLMRISRNTSEHTDSSKQNLIHLEGIYRPNDHPVYYEQRMYPQIGRLVTPADAIQLYGGTSAYFNTKQVSEPMFI